MKRCYILFFDFRLFGIWNKEIKRGEIWLDFIRMDNSLFLFLFSYGFVGNVFEGDFFKVDFLYIVYLELT